ncbi:MAG: glycosyltransferase [Vicinamibacterales bacterium]
MPVPEPADSARSPIGAAVREITAREAFDVVFVSGFGQWPGERAFGHARVVLDIDSLDGTIFERMRHTDRDIVSSFDVAATEALTRTVCARADPVLACSDVDAARIASLSPDARIDVMPNGVDTRVFDGLSAPPREGSPTVTFTGFLAYWPNADACTFFIVDILPRLRALVPDVRVRIVGRVAPEPVVTMTAAHGVELHADVPDIRPWFETSHVMVAPIRAGSGTRLEILEAFAARRPVVSTTIGCEGLDVRHDEHLLIADDGERFAEAVASLLHDRARADAMATRARELVEQRFAHPALAERMRTLFDSLADTPPRVRTRAERRA